MRRARGQTLVLFALTTLLVSLMVMMTLSIGAKAKNKLDLQASADAAAYSTAIATARTFNTGALLNRTAVSDWSAMAGIQALHAWGTLTGAYMETLGEMAYDFQHATPGSYCWMQQGFGPADPKYDSACVAGWAACASGCPYDSTEESNDARASAYEFWHARYSLYSPAMDGDNVNQHCLGDGANCTVPRVRLTPGEGQLDKDVSDQAKAVWRAVNNLTWLELETYQGLKDDLQSQSLASKVLRASTGLAPTGTPPPGYSVLGNVGGQPEAWNQLDGTLKTSSIPKNDHAYVDAVIGTVSKMFPTYFNAPPAQVQLFINEILANLAQTHPAAKWKVSINHAFSGCSYYAKDAATAVTLTQSIWSDNTFCQDPWDNDPMLGWKSAVAVARDQVWMSYYDPTQRRWRTAPDRPGNDTMEVGRVTAAIISSNDSDVSSHVGSPDDMAGGSPPGFVGGCHGNHGYWNVIPTTDHGLGQPGGTENVAGHDHDIIPGGLAYVFPQYTPLGAEGQPKLPVLFARHYDQPGARDPWDLKVGVWGANLDIGGERISTTAAVQGVLANGIAYYHRRGYWEEPANLLNPFWRATLVPADADRISPANPGPDQTGTALQQAGFDDAARLYRRFPRANFKGIQ